MIAAGRRAAHRSWYLDRKKGERSDYLRIFSQSFNFPPVPESNIIRRHLLTVALFPIPESESDPVKEE
jgi:hypothetical protein